MKRARRSKHPLLEWRDFTTHLAAMLAGEVITALVYRIAELLRST